VGAERALSVVFLLVASCATTSQDLQRVREHYRDSDFPKALALLRVLGDDPTALSPRERVEYAYLRGMTDLRLAEAAPRGQVRDAFRKNAEVFLGLASGLDRATPGALSEEQKARLQSSLEALASGTD
jgi:hypothetical protein